MWEGSSAGVESDGVGECVGEGMNLMGEICCCVVVDSARGCVIKFQLKETFKGKGNGQN